ncbi:hypothetical protein CFP56_041502 [Quercus suber]|uniref:Uncharacterized protein n=1 Tax=Quercus suber TaxID=58331 RepID=A0AAW0LL05_QUESU
MAKKRKSAATSLDEVDRTMYASFCSAANSLSQLYTQAMNHQKLSFQAGERQGLDGMDTCGVGMKSLLKCDIEILEDVEQICKRHFSHGLSFGAEGPRLDKSESSNALSRAQAIKLKGIDKW